MHRHSLGRPSRWSRAGLALAALLLSAGAIPARAQLPVRDPTIEDLPRPGYEPRTLRLGNLVVAPVVALAVTTTDNVFALDRPRRGDGIVTLSPRATAQYRTPRWDIRNSTAATLYRYAKNDRENVNEYGTVLDATRNFGTRHALTLRGGYDRTFERRSDPEADLGRSRPPALIDIFDGGLDYRYRSGRIGIVASAGATRFNYLPLADSDRDLVIYRGSLRGTVAVASRIGVFLQGYANRRDTRLTTDRGGVDRRTTTVGMLGGLSFALAGKLQGDVGAGVFRENPEDIGLPPYTGIGANGRLLWRPRVRTAIILDGFRGDVATVRIGAIGRIDTRLGIAIDQEVRHNLLLHVGAGLRDIHFRGGFDQDQRYRTGEVEGRYLLNRNLSVVANVGYMRRSADAAYARFRRWQGTLGIRFAY
jgi:hypothetical protein